MLQQETNIILFDGVCNLCNGFVQFVIRRDPEGKFKFASLQSESARQLLEHHGYTSIPLSSVVYIRSGQLFEMSNAVLQILASLGGLWPAVYIFRIIPQALRDAVYRYIARRRYLWFGRKDACMIPTPNLRQRFLS